MFTLACPPLAGIVKLALLRRPERVTDSAAGGTGALSSSKRDF
jgi:hypothetical protein